jgi:NAD-dependent deacetylase
MIPTDLLNALQRAHEVAVVTGAGISAESGIPTFRDALSGLWEQYDPRRLATPEAFIADPQLVWDWYASRREKLSQCRPNPGHIALAEFAQLVPRLSLITQNVDGLHQAAGSEEVIELHGNIRRVKCFEHAHPATEWDEGESPPHCAICGSLLRPDVVWFGELLPEAAFARAARAAEACDVFFSIGTSAQVYPAADLAFAALANGATVVEINAEPTDLTPHAHYTLPGRAGERLPELLQALREQLR